MADSDKLFREIFGLLIENEFKIRKRVCAPEEFERRFTYFQGTLEFRKLRQWSIGELEQLVQRKNEILDLQAKCIEACSGHGLPLFWMRRDDKNPPTAKAADDGSQQKSDQELVSWFTNDTGKSIWCSRHYHARGGQSITYQAAMVDNSSGGKTEGVALQQFIVDWLKRGRAFVDSVLRCLNQFLHMADVMRNVHCSHVVSLCGFCTDVFAPSVLTLWIAGSNLHEWLHSYQKESVRRYVEYLNLHPSLALIRDPHDPKGLDKGSLVHVVVQDLLVERTLTNTDSVYNLIEGNTQIASVVSRHSRANSQAAARASSYYQANLESNLRSRIESGSITDVAAAAYLSSNSLAPNVTPTPEQSKPSIFARMCGCGKNSKPETSNEPISRRPPMRLGGKDAVSASNPNITAGDKSVNWSVSVPKERAGLALPPTITPPPAPARGEMVLQVNSGAQSSGALLVPSPGGANGRKSVTLAVPSRSHVRSASAGSIGNRGSGALSSSGIDAKSNDLPEDWSFDEIPRFENFPPFFSYANPRKDGTTNVDYLVNFADVKCRIQVALNICRGLHELHSQSVGHFDIALKNVMFDVRTKTTTVIDLGSVCRLDSDGIARDLHENFAFSRPYLHPSRSRGQDWTILDDSHALLVVVAEVLGAPPAEVWKRLNNKWETPFPEDIETLGFARWLRGALIVRVDDPAKPKASDIIRRLEFALSHLKEWHLGMPIPVADFGECEPTLPVGPNGLPSVNQDANAKGRRSFFGGSKPKVEPENRRACFHKRGASLAQAKFNFPDEYDNVASDSMAHLVPGYNFVFREVETLKEQHPSSFFAACNIPSRNQQTMSYKPPTFTGRPMDFRSSVNNNCPAPALGSNPRPGMVPGGQTVIGGVVHVGPGALIGDIHQLNNKNDINHSLLLPQEPPPEALKGNAPGAQQLGVLGHTTEASK